MALTRKFRGHEGQRPPLGYGKAAPDATVTTERPAPRATVPPGPAPLGLGAEGAESAEGTRPGTAPEAETPDEGWTHAQLGEWAAERGLDLPSSASKAEKLALILAASAEADAATAEAEQADVSGDGDGDGDEGSEDA